MFLNSFRLYNIGLDDDKLDMWQKKEGMQGTTYDIHAESAHDMGMFL